MGGRGVVREQGGGGGGLEVKEGRSIPVTLSMKTETIFTKLLGDTLPSKPTNQGRAVELNLLSLQPVPINLLPSSFSPNHNQTLLLPPPCPPPLPLPGSILGQIAIWPNKREANAWAEKDPPPPIPSPPPLSTRTRWMRRRRRTRRR